MSKNSLSKEQDFLVESGETSASLLDQEYKRKQGYAEYWRLYKGYHWRWNEVDELDYTPVKNKCATLVNKSIAFLVGKPPTVNYPTEEIEQILAPFVNLILENSGGMATFSFDTVQMGSVAGDVFLKAVVDDSLYDRPTPGRVRIQICDSSDVDVRYTFADYNNSKPSFARIEWEYLNKDNEVQTRREEWTDWELKVLDPEILASGAEDPTYVRRNLLGRVPLTHIRNIRVGKEAYGQSDIEQIEALNKLLNARIRRYRDDVEYNGDPITLLFGARASSIEKGDSKTWGNLPIKSRVENLTLNTDFPAQQKLIEMLEDAIHEVSSIPKESITGNKSISNTSAVALHMNNISIVELTDRKKISYGPGFEDAIKMALELMYQVELREKFNHEWMWKYELGIDDFPPYQGIGIIEAVDKINAIIEQSEDISLKLKRWNNISIQFQDYLPKDKLIQLQIIGQRMKLGLLSRKGALRELGIDDIQTVLDEVQEDVESQIGDELEMLYGKTSPNVTQGALDKSETPAGAAAEMEK